jgi:hypothetical protein
MSKHHEWLVECKSKEIAMDLMHIFRSNGIEPSPPRESQGNWYMAVLPSSKFDQIIIQWKDVVNYRPFEVKNAR